MYTLKVVAMIEDTVVETERRVAFRKLELVQEPLSQGLSFYFKVNDKAIFMKGSNWIPAHVIPTLNNYDTYYDLLYSAKEAHMNMLRVSGCIIYRKRESNVLYIARFGEAASMKWMSSTALLTSWVS